MAMRKFLRKVFCHLSFALLLTAGKVIGSPSENDSVFLFTSFHDADQKYLRFLYSYDGLHWTNVPGIFLTAKVGTNQQLRDPSLTRGPDGVFQLVWTTGWHGDQGFGYANSADLIHWSDQKFIPVMTNEPTTVNVWAPEIFYDSTDKQFIITWAATIPGRFPDLLERRDTNHRLYCTTTRDFKDFAPTKLFYDPGFSVIDPFILHAGTGYVLLLKDNSRPRLNLRVAFGDSPLGPWKGLSPPLTQKYAEGPCALKTGPDWLVYFDAYRDKKFGVLRTLDFQTFTDASPESFFPPDHKHGTAIPVPRLILNGLLQLANQH